MVDVLRANGHVDIPAALRNMQRNRMASLPDNFKLHSADFLNIPPEMYAPLRAALARKESLSVPTTSRRRGKQYDDENRGQRLLALMAERQVGPYTAAREACKEDLAGANLEACTKRLQRWFRALG